MDIVGRDYRGHIAMTTTGRICQKWSSQTPHTHPRTPERHPFAGLGDHNYCRNPILDPRPWCYTVDFEERWEYCDVGESSPNCDDPGEFIELLYDTNKMRLKCNFCAAIVRNIYLNCICFISRL